MFQTTDLFSGIQTQNDFEPFRGATKLCLLNTKSHFNRVYSVKSRQKPDYGRRRYLTSYVVMKNVTPSVSEKMRQKVLASGVKNVHAHLVGQVISVGEAAKAYIEKRLNNIKGIAYDPFKTSNFVWLNEGFRLPRDQQSLTALNHFAFADEVLFFPTGCGAVQ